jgi:hypothetical protein
MMLRFATAIILQNRLDTSLAGVCVSVIYTLLAKAARNLDASIM